MQNTEKLKAALEDNDLDFFTSTSDPNFNKFAHSKYFSCPDENIYKVYIMSAYLLYFYIRENPDRPHDCLKKAKYTIEKAKPILDIWLKDPERYFLSEMINLLEKSADFDKLTMPYIQLIDYLSRIRPIIEEAMQHEWNFDIDDIKNKLTTIDDLNSQMDYLVDNLTKFEDKLPVMHEIEYEYYENTNFKDSLLWEIVCVHNQQINQSKTTVDLKIEEPQNLLGVWEGDVKSYQSVIDNLKEVYLPLDGAFISDTNGKLTWLNRHGYVSYLVGFVDVLIEKRWVADKYSGAEWQRILRNTFDINCGTKQFQPEERAKIIEKYKTPFRILKTNLPQIKP